MNYQINDMIDNICKYFNRIDLLMFSHTNKRFRTYSQKYLLKHKNNKAFCKFTINYDYISKKVILCVNAAFEGYLNILMYLRKNGCDWNSYTCSSAASNGHLEVLKWARENGCNWTSYTCSQAARNGHLEVLKWARENGCDWNSYTCSSAAKNGHLEVLKWARENGYGYDWTRHICLKYAEQNNHKLTIEWIINN